jgi:uridine kinase
MFFFVLVSGASCSGKTTLCAAKRAVYGEALFLSLDDFYLENCVDWEDEAAIDWQAVRSKVREYIKNNNNHPFIVIEGFRSFFLYEELAVGADVVCVHLEVEKEVAMKRRAERPLRTGELPEPENYFGDIVWPAQEQYEEKYLKKIPRVFSEWPDKEIRERTGK